MIEIPEAITIAQQINESIAGKTIINAIANFSPHKFTWYNGDPKEYNTLLKGKTIISAKAWSGLVEITTETAAILVGDGVNLRYHVQKENQPKKHQLLVEFEDGTAISGSVQMYGGLWCFRHGEYKNPYYLVAKEKPTPLLEEFDSIYFNKLIETPEVQKLSIKAFLATEQRIPGFGNGVLQDVLWLAKLHPKRKVSSLSMEEKKLLFDTLKKVLLRMAELGGRDTEKDLYGNTGGYKTVMSKKNADTYCPQCGEGIVKESYLGGSIYYCKGCQRY